jgi:hypothetical protein
MAFVETRYCHICEQATMHRDHLCAPCEERKRRTELASWQALSIEEKLLSIHKRLLKLESGPVSY